jgi:hypothetical protein
MVGSDPVQHPELHKKTGVHYAFTDDGLELPLIDVTHQAFAITRPDEVQREAVEKFMREQRDFAKLPKFVQRAMMWMFFRKSRLGNSLRTSDGTFLPGVATYLLKLPPEMLGEAYARPVDRRVVSAAPSLSMRLRLQDMATLAVEALTPALASDAERPLVFINIAGGPALDSMNALLLIQRDRPELLASRSVRIHVLDGDHAGPSFGARALAAFRSKGAPLERVNVRLEHERFDWSEPAQLRKALERAAEQNAFTLGASEGGLFEYGSDPDILSVLAEFRDSKASLLGVIGSVTRDDEFMKIVKRTSRAATRPRGIAVFERLCRSVGYEIRRAIERPMSDDVWITPQT